MIINYVLILCACCSLYYSVRFYSLRKKDNPLGKYILLLGFCAFLWCIGYGIMGLSPRLDLSPTYRRIALFGASGFMCSEALMFAHKTGKSKTFKRILAAFMLLLMAGDVFIWGADNVRSFYRVDNRTLYVNGESNGYYYQPIFMFIMMIILVVLFLQWKSVTIYKRDKRFQSLLLATNLILVVGTIPDTILPILGVESFPSSPLAAFLTMVGILSVNYKYIYFDNSRESLTRYAYDYGKAGFMAFNMAGRLKVANMYSMKAVEIAEVDSQRLSDLFNTGSYYDNDIVAEIVAARESTWQFEAKNNEKSFSLNFTVISDSNGDDYCIVCGMYDRSDENELIEKIRKSGDTKSSFLANMSHEIRTPINVILGMNEMILRESSDSNILSYAKDMETAGSSLLNIVNDILDYSKLQSNMMDLINDNFDLSEIINEMVVKYRQKANDKGLDFKVSVDSTIPVYLNGDEIRLNQILKNILDNAVKYTDKGEIILNVEKNDSSDEEAVIKFSVTDTGKGIKEKELKGLFDAFSRADHNSNQTIAGTGLGLAIVGSLSKMMGGDVDVKSDFGKGTIFTVVLPFKTVSYQQIGDYEKSLSEYEASHQNGWKGEYTAPAARILIVDDNSVNLNVAKYLLKRTEAIVDTVNSGEKAIEMVRDNSYQIVFLDHIMQGIDGIETLKIIKENHLCEDAAFICLSANDVQGARQMYSDYGFDDFLPKPMSGGSIERKVYEWLPKNFIHEKINNFEYVTHSNKISLSTFTGKDELVYLKENNRKSELLEEELTHVFIFNPEATSEASMEKIRKSLSKNKNLKYFIFTSSYAGGETELVKKIQVYFPEGRLRIYSVGGSGTLRNIINGIDDFERVEIACCPMGLTNDFMKTFGYDQKRFKEINNLITGEVVKVDYIKTTGGIALNTFSMGLDSKLVETLDITRMFKVFGLKMPYIISFIWSMIVSMPDEYEIFVDDECFEGTFSQLIFGNGNMLGGSFTFSKRPLVNDGKGAVLLGGNLHGFTMLPVVMAMVSGDMSKLSKLTEMREAKRFSIRRRDGGQLAMNFDGEMVYGYEKWEAEIVREGLKFVIPKGVKLHE